MIRSPFRVSSSVRASLKSSPAPGKAEHHRKHRRLFLHVFSSLSYPSVYSSRQFHFRLASTFCFEIHLPLVILLTPPVKSYVTVGKEVILSGPSFSLLTSQIKPSVILPSKMADLGLAKNCSSG